jgi:hypothetical protein
MISRLNHIIPNTDQRGDPTVTYKGNKLSEMRGLQSFTPVLPKIEAHYQFETRTLTPFVFEWFPTGYSGAPAQCDSYQISGKRAANIKWSKTKDYDFTVVIFLNDYNSGVDFDERFEVRGGKLEFPTHDFGFNPERGTMVVFPSRPNFVHAVTAVDLGDLNLIKFHIIAKDEYHYDMSNFPGGYKEWFRNS